MQKINHLFNASNGETDDTFSNLVSQANQHLALQQFWQDAVPAMLAQSSFASSLNNDILTVFANNSGVATKIKLTSASLLTQLQNLQKTNPKYNPYKVTGISVKVQVKPQEKQQSTAHRHISAAAAATLRNLASNLDNPALAEKLNKIASNR